MWVDVFENIDEVIDNLTNMQEDLLKKIVEIEVAISEVESEVERSILVMHYMESQPFAEIEKRLPYSERSIYNYHVTALDNIKLPKELQQEMC